MGASFPAILKRKSVLSNRPIPLRIAHNVCIIHATDALIVVENNFDVASSALGTQRGEVFTLHDFREWRFVNVVGECMRSSVVRHARCHFRVDPWDFRWGQKERVLLVFASNGQPFFGGAGKEPHAWSNGKVKLLSNESLFFTNDAASYRLVHLQVEFDDVQIVRGIDHRLLEERDEFRFGLSLHHRATQDGECKQDVGFHRSLLPPIICGFDPSRTSTRLFVCEIVA